MYELLKFVNGKQKLLELQRNLNCIMICFTFWILFLGASLALMYGVQNVISQEIMVVS